MEPTPELATQVVEALPGRTLGPGLSQRARAVAGVLGMACLEDRCPELAAPLLDECVDGRELTIRVRRVPRLEVLQAFFVLGLSTVFLFLGFTASAFGRFFLSYQGWFNTLAGAEDFAGMVEDAQLALECGLTVAQADELPTWSPGDEFEATRTAALADLEANAPSE